MKCDHGSKQSNLTFKEHSSCNPLRKFLGLSLIRLKLDFAEQKNLTFFVLLIIQGNDLLDAELKNWTNMVKNCDLPEARRLICKLEKHVPKLVNMSGSKRTRYIRPAVCISPWGNLATLWRLIDLQSHFSKCSLSVELNVIRTKFNHVPEDGGVCCRDTCLAFEDADFLKLMSSIIDPKEWADLNTPIIDNVIILSTMVFVVLIYIFFSSKKMVAVVTATAVSTRPNPRYSVYPQMIVIKI